MPGRRPFAAGCSAGTITGLVARASLLVIFMLWLSWTPNAALESPSVHHLAALLAVGVGAIAGMGLYSRVMARRLVGATLHQDLRRFSFLIKAMRSGIPLWFGVAVFILNWPAAVHRWIGPAQAILADSPAFLIGTAPPLILWCLLWWAAYPAERAFREHWLLARMDAEMPLYSGPTFFQYLIANFRIQLLFLYAPVLCILVLRDLASAGIHLLGVPRGEGIELLIAIGSMLPVVVAAPILLVRILPTSRLPDAPLSRRLEELCSRVGIRARRILLWRTHNNLGNAAVMGVVPRARYLLVTDLLLQSMTPDQIVAVFAHEMGHIHHRHLPWMVSLVFCFMFAAFGPGETVLMLASRWIVIEEPFASLAMLALLGPVFVLLFGHVVRQIERQADVFAARMAPQLLDAPEAASSNDVSTTFVRSGGASLVCGALERIALINNVPLHAHEWLHGSIASRTAFLRQISDDPEATWRFDRRMRRLQHAVGAVCVVCGIWVLVNLLVV